MNQINRREALKWSALVAGAWVLGPHVLRGAAETGKRILFFTKSSGYEHGVIKRKGAELGFAEKILIDLGKQNGMEVVASKDGSLFTAEYLAGFDGFVFYTTGDLTVTGLDKQPGMTAAGKQALLDAVAGGKAFIGVHSASDTFHSPAGKIDPYIAMVGGEFIIHGKQQDSTSLVSDGKFPGAPEQNVFRIREEWYTFKNYADDLHVILAQQTEGMSGEMYRRPAYPSTWARLHGKGRVFYTSMGHREDVWTNPMYQKLLLGGIAWATGGVAAEISANMDAVTPGARTLPKKAATTQ